MPILSRSLELISQRKNYRQKCCSAIIRMRRRSISSSRRLDDPATHQYIGAISFHAWRGLRQLDPLKLGGCLQRIQRSAPYRGRRNRCTSAYLSRHFSGTVVRAGRNRYLCARMQCRSREGDPAVAADLGLLAAVRTRNVRNRRSRSVRHSDSGI